MVGGLLYCMCNASRKIFGPKAKPLKP